MKYLSVCSGVEAATVAWHDLGFEPIAFSEIEKFPSEVLNFHYPDVPNLGDMTKYKEWNLNDSIDLLVGGTPCQSFSVAGLRKGLEDPRGNLMLTYVGILDKFRPQWCVWENVPGVLSSNGGRDFGSFLGALVELGYGFSYRVLDAQHFGVPQRRRRVFVVACLGNWISPAKVLFERESLLGDTKKSRSKKQGVAKSAQGSSPNGEHTVGSLLARDYKGIGNQDLTDGRGLIVYETHPADSRVKEMGDVCQTVTSRWGTGGGNVPIALQDVTGRPKNQNGKGWSDEGVSYTVDTQGIQGVAYGFEPGIAKREGSPNRFVEDGTPTLRAHMGDNQTSVAYSLREDAKANNFSATELKVTPALQALRPSVQSHHAQTFVTNHMAVRRLTPIECERLQGFPDDYTNIKEKCPDGPRYKAMGNSMAVPVMRWIGQRIKELS